MDKTYGVKYIGSKNKINPYIQNIVDSLSGVDTVIDCFTGTTRVAQLFKMMGKTVITSDKSWAAEAYAHTFIANKGSNRHLQDIIDHFNHIKPVEGWLTSNYCDVVTDDGGVVKVWQRKNGMVADAIRDEIETLDLEYWEKMTLITSLIFALDRVDSTVGVQQAYLKKWSARSYNDMMLTLPIVVPEPQGQHFTGDCLDIDYPTADLAYLDPPYSAHSYSTYYHIWDSVFAWDKPEVGLKTNRRVDRIGRDNTMKSSWNVKKDVLPSTISLIDKLDCRYILMSYSDESLIDRHDLTNALSSMGNVEVIEVDYDRNIMCRIGNAENKQDKKTKNKEMLILLER